MSDKPNVISELERNLNEIPAIPSYLTHTICRRNAIKQVITMLERQNKQIKALEALEKRCNALEALEKRLDDSDRINVVRCSDCIYWQPPTYQEQEDGSTVGHCTAALNGQQTDAYWFCADGTR